MFAVLHSDINFPKSGLFHLTGQPYCKKSRPAKVKDDIINKILRDYLIDRYISFIYSPTFVHSTLLISFNQFLYQTVHSFINILFSVIINQYLTGLNCVSFIKTQLCQKLVRAGNPY
jgi:hypothetical protein